MCAIVIDVGNLFVEKRSIQQAADAAALAAAQRLPGVACDTICQSGVATLAGNYSGENLAGGGTGPLPPCDATITSNCYEILGTDRVRVRLTKSVSTFFGGLVGKSSYVVGARAVGSRFAYTTTTPGDTVVSTGSTVVSTGSTVVNTTTTGASNIAIFARGQDCDSFFVPGNNVHVTGIATNGGVGNIKAGNNIVDAISMQKPFYNTRTPAVGTEQCDYTAKINNGVSGNVVPDPPSFRTPPNAATDAPILTAWPVPWPDLTTEIFRVPNSHCLMSTDTLTTKALQSGQAALTTSAPHCLEVGASVTVAGVETRFNGTYTVTGVTGTTFSYAKSLSGFSKTVSTKALTNNVATLTTTAVHGLLVGDIVTVAGVDSTFNGTYTVTAVPSTTKLSYAKSIPPVALTVTTKALAAGVATLTTSVAHNLAVGASVTVDINNPRFDGTYTVTAVTATTFSYAPTPVALTVTNKAVTAGVATLTTSAAHGLSVGNTVTVAVNDARFDGTFAITAVTATTFSYASPSVAVTSWAVAGNIATLTATSPHGLAVGNSVTVTSFAGKGSPTYLNGGPFTLTAVTANTFSYAFTHANASGTDNGSAQITTVASTAATGTATPVTLASAAATGTVTVPGFVTSTASGGTVTFTGDVASTATGGTATFGAAANATIASGWTTTHAPGIYYIDASVTALENTITVTASNTNFNGYTFVAPLIVVDGGNNSFTYYSGAPQQTALWGYCGMLGTAICGDGVHMSGSVDGSDVTGSMFCGPIDPPAGGATPKCWYGGDGTTHSTFTGVMEGWQIEYTIKNATFNGVGPGIGGTTSTTTTITPGSTTITPGSTTTNPDVVNTVGTGSNLDE
jgi:F0F1-type ATP synthase membrane subunit c/vacuolar-type H+-ATPase subunit K